ncbi:MAG: vanillate O-demethylase oxidoreductase VanB, partial [Proteobacteria bacterium]
MGQLEIKKQVLLKVPKLSVWKAISESDQFGSWFGMKLEGNFAPGHTTRGTIQPTTVDAKIAEMQKPHAGAPVELHVDQMNAEKEFSFRWHAYPPGPGETKDDVPMTLVSFT